MVAKLFSYGMKGTHLWWQNYSVMNERYLALRKIRFEKDKGSRLGYERYPSMVALYA